LKRRRTILLVILLLVATGITIGLDPSRRVHGWVGGEPFFQGRSASAWSRELRTPDETRSADAIAVLAAGKGEAVPVCSWVLRSAKQPEARWRAADALRQMGKDAAAARSEIVAALSDSDPLVRGVAIRAIAELAPDAPDAVSALMALFPDVDSIRAVSRFGAAGGDAVPQLTELLRHEDPTVRWQAARTLGKIGVPALTAVPELARLTTSDPESLVREHAAEAMGDIGPAAAAGIPALVMALNDPNSRVRRDAVRALGQMGPAAKNVLAAVEDSKRDSDPNVKEAAMRASRLIDPAQNSK
jgi:HEAT repeat protein